jgi:hypothetical protein
MSFNTGTRIRSGAYLASPLSSRMRPPWAPHQWGRNMNRQSIDYACRPRLRDRLTLRGLTWRRKP